MNKQQIINKVLYQLMKTEECLITDDHLKVVEQILNDVLSE